MENSCMKWGLLSSTFIVTSDFWLAATVSDNFLHQLKLQFCFPSCLHIAIPQGPLYPSSLSCPCLGENSHSSIWEQFTPLSFNHWTMYIMWCPLNFLFTPVACFIVYCVTWLVKFYIVYVGTMQYCFLLVTQLSFCTAIDWTMMLQNTLTERH
jgi:hypothetical protein